MPDLNEQYKKIHETAYADVQRNFSLLASTVHKLDPIKLLSQLSLTYLIVSVNEFVDESSDMFKRARYIEFLAGYLLSNKYTQNTRMDVDGRDIKNVENLLEEYFQSISIYLVTSPTSHESEKGLERVITHAKIHSLLVRGESYPHLLRQTAQSIYSQHNDWVVKHLGFTITDALTIAG